MWKRAGSGLVGGKESEGEGIGAPKVVPMDAALRASDGGVIRELSEVAALDGGNGARGEAKEGSEMRVYF